MSDELTLPPIVTMTFDSPVGRLIAAAVDDGICWLDFAEDSRSERNLAALRQRFVTTVVSGEHRWLQLLRVELAAYFERSRAEFTVPIVPRGTPFQERVWRELCLIPHGTTICYEELASRIGRPTAVRAVANANGQNRINILIPCHRVIGKNGDLTGYGGGLSRKRQLLDHEQRASK